MDFFEGLQAVANIHPLFVHFPIALLLVAVALFFAGNFIFKEEFITAAKWNLFLGSLSGVVTAITGLIAANSVPHNEEIHQIMILHRNIMIFMVFLSLCLSGYLFYKTDLMLIKKNVIFNAGLVLMALLLSIGADYGGKMVFEYGTGTKLFQKENHGAEHNHEHNHNDTHNNHDH